MFDSAPGLPTLTIHQRRYLGNKARLLPALRAKVEEVIGPLTSVADVFAGTGSVSHGLNGPSVVVLSNDLLYSNYLCLRAFLAEDLPPAEEIDARLMTLDALDPIQGYVYEHFGDRYFTLREAGRIDAVREQIARWREGGEITHAMEATLVASLIYAADRIANTCGHYDAWRRAAGDRAPLRLSGLEVDRITNRGNRVFNQDANTLVEHIAAEVLYLDPPYNSRQYSDTYHLLENIARWEKPAVHGVAAKMDRSHLKSAYCGAQATAAMAELVARARCRWILLSYNNMGTRGDLRSNARMKDEDLISILRTRGEVEIFTWPFKAFNAGLSDLDEGHEERLFVCEVRRGPTYEGLEVPR